MLDTFEEEVFDEFKLPASKHSNLLKSKDANLVGKTKIVIGEESHDGVKFVLKKDENDIIKEIKFICTCGKTKTVYLDYSE